MQLLPPVAYQRTIESSLHLIRKCAAGINLTRMPLRKTRSRYIAGTYTAATVRVRGRKSTDNSFNFLSDQHEYQSRELIGTVNCSGSRSHGHLALIPGMPICLSALACEGLVVATTVVDLTVRRRARRALAGHTNWTLMLLFRSTAV